MLSRLVVPAKRLLPALQVRALGGSSFLAREEAQARVIDVLKRFPKLKDNQNLQVDLKTHLADNLGLDSLDQVELMMAVEEEFAIEIPDENLEKIHTVDDLVSFVTSNPMSQ